MNSFKIFNEGAELDGLPCAVMRPKKEAQLALALKSMHLDPELSKLRVSVKNGGHQPSAWAISGDVLLDLKDLRGIDVYPASETVQVAAGEKWGAVHRAVTDKGWMVHGSTDHGVGVSGSTLVGGITMLSRRRGLVANQLQRLRLCLMNGTVLDLQDASTDPQHQKLFQLFRAGVGAAALPIGVITELTFKLFPPEEKYFGLLSLEQDGHTYDTAYRTLRDLIEVRKQVDDPRMGADVMLSTGSGPTKHRVALLLFYDGPYEDGVKKAAPFLARFSAKPQVFDSYANFTAGLTVPGNKRLSSWHGGFVSERGVLRTFDSMRKENQLKGGVDIAIEDRTVELMSGQDKHAQNRTVLINFVCMHGRSCSEDGWDEKLYQKHFKPNQIAEYLGYLNGPRRKDIALSLGMWRPASMSTLRCWRAGLGADMLVGGSAFPGDSEEFRRSTSMLQQSMSRSESSSHLSQCHEHSLLESPTDWCGDGNRELPFHGQVALLIGGTGALGREAAHLLSHKGAHVVIAARSMEKCQKIADEAWAMGGLIECDEVELTNPQSMLSLMERHSSASILLHLAAAKQKALWANHLSTVLLSMEMLKHNPQARIVAVGSGAADSASTHDVQSLLSGRPFEAGSFREYCATKNMQFQALNALQAEKGADIRLITPTVSVWSNLLDDDMFNQLPEEVHGRIEFGDAKLVAAQVVNAALPGSKPAQMWCGSGCSTIQCSRHVSAEKNRIWTRSLELLGMLPHGLSLAKM
jgi:NAD(P)-dependent dehydrogenase (short-subunit alcohol dehydrogenase family)